MLSTAALTELLGNFIHIPPSLLSRITRVGPQNRAGRHGAGRLSLRVDSVFDAWDPEPMPSPMGFNSRSSNHVSSELRWSRPSDWKLSRLPIQLAHHLWERNRQ